jgi:hypothetical protein
VSSIGLFYFLYLNLRRVRLPRVSAGAELHRKKPERIGVRPAGIYESGGG